MARTNDTMLASPSTVSQQSYSSYDRAGAEISPMHRNENMHLSPFVPMRNGLRKKQRETSTSSFTSGSIYSQTTDDYGECDVSLRSYNTELDATAGFNFEEANEMLFDMLRLFGPSSNQITQCAGRGEKYSFRTPGHDKKIDISIREDSKAIVFTTVVHKVKHSALLQEPRRRGGSHYSLLTKMMKFNTILNRSGLAGQIGAYDGTFVFFRNICLQVLQEGPRLHEILEDYILKAVEISRDFTNQPEQKRRRFRLM